MPSSSQSDRVAFWRDLIAQRQSSQLTVRQLCAQAGVSPASFYHWQQKLCATEQPSPSHAAPATALLPVRIVEDRGAELTIELPQAVRIQLPLDCDEVILQRVLRVALQFGREHASC